MTNIVLEPAIVDVVNELATIQAQQTALKEREDALKAKLAGTLLPGEVGCDENGTPRVKVSPSMRWDANVALAVLPPEVIKDATITTLDRAMVQAFVPPALYKRCQVAGAPRITLL